MKKLTAFFLCGALMTGLAACGRSTSSADGAGTTSRNAASTDTASADASTDAGTAETSTSADSADGGADADAAGTGKALVVYYSASGNTERVAGDIATVAGADLFEIVPTEVYTSEDLDWTNADSRVSREHDDESLREVPLTTTEVENWDSYDTVFIGYPIWWGIAAWPVDGFVKANDFTGKTVIPFATSASSGMGQSGLLLAQMAGTGNWQDGQRFSSGASSADVQKWVDSLGL